MNEISQLGFALLGLIHQQPMSGYDLRKVFTATAMGSYSDSPGAIYPALKRLEAGGLLSGSVEKSASLRKRRVFVITADGLAAFKTWLKSPVSRNAVVRNVDELLLRFAFMDGALGPSHSLGFLEQFAEHVANYIPELRQFLAVQRNEMPTSARLALECGIQRYGSHLDWARSSIAVYQRRKRERK
jgi:DNA-binding PadR family transcriptional regulator